MRFSREEGQLIIDKSFEEKNSPQSSDDPQYQEFLAFDQDYFLLPVKDASRFSGKATTVHNLSVYVCFSDYQNCCF